MNKKCSMCNIEKSINEFYFRKKNKTYISRCKICEAICRKNQYIKNKESLLLQKKEYYQRNKEEIKIKVMNHYGENKEKINKIKRKYYKLYYQRNKEEINKKHREYDHKTREKRRKHKSNYKKQKYHCDVCHRLKRIVSQAIRHALRKNLSSKKGKSILNFLPYTIQELRMHLESQFESWMNWNNYGVLNLNIKTWQIDHIVPQSNFSYDSMEHPNFQKCWALRNLRPLCAIKNLNKSNKLEDFYE